MTDFNDGPSSEIKQMTFQYVSFVLRYKIFPMRSQ